jgi:molybdopterin-guanine dinucleotide biosynthesis protein A
MLTEPRPQITGLILAGGLARRMGGIDKGLQILDGRTLVAHAIERLAPQVTTLLINANRNADVYAAFGHPVVVDRIGGFAGPLAGIHAGLSACTTPLLASVPCDAPFLPPDLIDRLCEALERERSDVAIPITTDGLQPTFALMRREVLADLTAFIAAGHRKMQDWCRLLPLSVVEFPDGRAFANLNTPAELDAINNP